MLVREMKCSETNKGVATWQPLICIASFYVIRQLEITNDP